MMDPTIISWMGATHFHICKNKTVLEIGPYTGWFTKEILKHDPQKLTLLESSDLAVIGLEQDPVISEKCQIIYGDVHRDLGQVGKVDVVILLGVIYHSHAPLYMLEEIVNICDPATILINVPGGRPVWEVTATIEKANDPGMRYVSTPRKTCNVVLTLHDDVLVCAMNNLEYQMTKIERYDYDPESHRSTVLFQFEKKSLIARREAETALWMEVQDLTINHPELQSAVDKVIELYNIINTNGNVSMPELNQNITNTNNTLTPDSTQSLVDLSGNQESKISET